MISLLIMRVSTFGAQSWAERWAGRQTWSCVGRQTDRCMLLALLYVCDLCYLSNYVIYDIYRFVLFMFFASFYI